MKKSICFIAQFPPPIHGLSKAVDTLYHSELQKDFDLERVDIKNNKKILANLWKIFCSNADLFYFTISQTRGGNLRDLVIFKILELRNKKCLVHLHGGYYRQLVDKNLPTWQRKWNYNAIGKLEGAIVLSDILKANFEGMLSGDRIFIVPNCVDDELILSDEELVEKIERLKGKKIQNILYLSNFMKSKGYPNVLELAKMEKERIDSGKPQRFHFDFAGAFFDDSDKIYLKQFIMQYHLEDITTYHGVVEGEKKRTLLKKSDIFVLLTQNEGQPISILEAMGSGLFVVTTDVGGIPDIVKDNENGIVLNAQEPFNPQECYLKMDKMDIERIAMANRIRIKGNHTENIYIANMRQAFLYVMLLQRKGS